MSPCKFLIIIRKDLREPRKKNDSAAQSGRKW